MILARVWTPLLQVGHSPLQSLGTKDRKMITQVTPRVRGMVTPPSPGGKTTGGIGIGPVPLSGKNPHTEK